MKRNKEMLGDFNHDDKIKNNNKGGEEVMKFKTPLMLVLTIFSALLLCGAVSAGTPLQENQTGTVSGDLYYNASNPWAATGGVTFEVTQNNTLPAYTSIDSAMVYVNVYSGSGTNNWPVRTTIKLDGNDDGDYDDAGELLGVEDMNIPGSTDGTVYWLNDHCNRVYSDYQVWYNVTGLITSTNPTLYVKTENMGGDGYDGRIKLLALCVAYNDGDTDQVHFWVLNGQDWINAATSPSTTTFNTSSFNGQVSSATLNTVALTSTDGSYTFNGNAKTGNLTETGSYYKENTWDVTNDIISGQNSTLTYANVGASFKLNLATLAIREGAPAPPVANFTATPTNGDSPLNVQFSNTSTGLIDTYAWDFNNDGTTDSTLPNPTWTYQSRGNYSVKLTVTGPGGTNTTTKTNLINVTGVKIWDVYPTDPQYTVRNIMNSAVPGDIVYFHAGTYTANSGPLYQGNFDKNGVTWRGEGKDVTFLNYYTSQLPASNTCLEGFSISFTGSVGSIIGSNVVVKNCVINMSSRRFTISSGASAIFENNTFLNGTHTYGTVSISSGGQAIVSNCAFQNNTCAIMFYGSGSVIKNNVFDSNVAAIKLGAANLGTNTFYLNTFTNNTQTFTLTSGSVVAQNFSSPAPILYSYNSHTYIGYMGNYWSDYEGDDEDGNGIGDTPYTEPNGFGVDNYPLMAPVSQYNFDAVQADFTAIPVSGVVPLQVQFTDTSLGAITSYAWDFDNNGSIDSTQKNPTWTYNRAGNYTVKLTVSNAGASDEETKTDYITVMPDTEAPNVTANPAGGSSDSLVQVTLSATDNVDPNPSIYYTTDGSDPTTNSTPYTVPINIPVTTTLKFIAVDINGNVSNVRSETYTINDAQSPTVTANPAGGTYTSKTQVTLSATDNIDPNPVIYYTLDGTEPTTNSTRYTGPFNITANTTNTLKFIAVDATGNTSPIQTEVYNMVPDLSVAVSVTNYPLSKNKAMVTVNNSDAVDVGAFNVTVQIDGNSTTVNIPGLAAGGSTTFTVTDTVGHQVGENITVNVMVDPENMISEADEANNSNTTTVTVATAGDNYYGGRFSVGHDLVNTAVYKEGHIGVKVLAYGGYHWFDGSGTATWTASDLNMPVGATLISARLYEARTWYGYPDYTIQFNGHDTQQPIGYYWDMITGQNVFDVTQYFNLYENNTAVITGGSVPYGTILIVIYEAPSEPYRQIWINEGADCLYDGYGATTPPFVCSTADPFVGYTMIDNATTNNLASAKVTVVTPSGEDGDSDFMYFNSQVFYQTSYNHSVIDPGIHYFDVTSALQNGTNELGVIGYSYLCYTISVVEVTQQNAPVAQFTSNVTTGTVPLQVQFTDTSSNSPTSWLWEYNNGSGWTTFASGTDAAAQNPLYTFTTPGTYDIRSTATNSVGSDDETKLGFITVNSSVDLTIDGTVNTVPSTAVFAKEANNLTITIIKNQGTATTTNILVALYASDVSDTVPVATAVIESLAGGATTTLNLVDPTIRNLEGGTVTYTVKLDPDNLITEIDEANNSKLGSVLPVRYNGYKGKQYWENGSSISTKRYYDIRGDLVYSSGDSVYHSGNTWTSTTTNWTAGNFNIPSTAVVKEAWLYVPYNWDETSLFPGHVTLAFNSQNINYANWYSDKSNFGGYGNYTYGMLTYNVTSLFQASSGNSATLTRDGASSVALYPFTLLVVYEDSHSTHKQIFINEEWDLLGLSATSYATTLEEATANAPFTGPAINIGDVKNATLHSFAASAGPNEGNVFFNGNSIATSIWQGNSNTANAVQLDVKNNLLATGNVASIQENTGTMSAMQQILVIEYNEPAPTAEFTATPTTGTTPLTVSFTNQSTGTITSYQWDFDNNGTTDSTETNPIWTYSTAGTYTVKLTVTGPGGSDEETKTDYITVNEPAPVAKFTGTPTTGTAPLQVAFTNTSTGTITSYQWDFDNNGTTDSTDTNPTWIYNTAGVYTVKLTATGPGGSDEETKTDYITIGEPAPVAAFTGTPTSGTAPLQVAFTNQSTGSVTSYVWDFNNDGTTDSTDTNPTWTYSTAGTYTVKLTATGAGGSDDEIKTNYITVNEPVPVAQFTATPVTGTAPLQVTFTNTSTGTITSYAWDFDNNGTTDSTETNPTWTYNSAGTFTVKLTVTGPGGSDEETKTDYITVNEPAPVAQLVGTPTTGTKPLQVVFTNTSTGTITSYAWDFDNNGTTDSTETNPTWTYNTAGTYTVKLTVTGPGGSDDEVKTDYITVNEPVPVAGFTANPTSGTAPLNVAFTDASTGNITSRAWDFQNDGTVDSAQTNPTYTYNTQGTYVVKLTVTGPGGSNSTTRTIEVKSSAPPDENPAPVAGFTANPTSGTAPLKVVFTDASTGDITSRAWDFQNDGTIDSTQTNPTWTYNTPGTYVVKLTVTGPGGSASKTVNITVNQTDTTAPVPKAELKGGLFRTMQTVTLTATDDQDTNPKIYYTLNGAAPTTTSTLYTAPISITKTTTLRFIAVDGEGNTSPVQSETYTIDTTAPAITLVDPANSAVRVALGKTIKVTFTEAIQKGSKFWIELINSSGKAIPFTASVSGKVLTIDPTANLAESRYKLIIHTGTVTDMAGNPFSLKSTCFTTGTSPLIKSTDPKNNTKNIARNKAIRVTFNENIKPGKNYWIELKASNGTSVKISKSISGKLLTITHPRLKANTKYTLILHTGAVTDTAGNPMALKTISFTTGRT